MAVIGKIRNRSGLLIGVIGVAMVLFVAGDLLNSNGGSFNQVDTEVGEINGLKISYEAFESKVAEAINGQNVTADQMEQVRARAWNQLLQENITFKEYEKLGITVVSEELFDQIKNNPRNPILTQYFTNPQTGAIYEQFQDPATGTLSSQSVMYYIKSILNSEQKESWLPVEKALRQEAMTSKYNALLKAALGASMAEGRTHFMEENTRLTFSYLSYPFSEVSDEEIVIQDADLKSYYNKHKNEKEFQQEETMRGAKVVLFTVAPTEDDYNDARNQAEGLIGEFNRTENDTIFVLQNADSPDNGFRTIGRYELPYELDSLLFTAPVDTVVGPFEFENGFNIAKKLGVKQVSDSVKARHILLSLKPESDTAAVKARIDSVKNALSKGASFASLAEALSEDLGSARTGGDLDWFTQGVMVPPFNDACFNGKKGDMPIVMSQFGYHLIEILDKTKEKEKMEIALVNRRIEPSNATFDMIYNKASEFSISNSTMEAFDAAISESRELNVREFSYIKEADKTLGEIESPRAIIRWVYENEIGSVSEPFEAGNQFVVAMVTSIKNKGVLPLEEVELIVEEKVKKEKKSEFILGKIAGATDLPTAGSNTGKNIQNVTDLNFVSPSIPAIGPELKVLGTAFGMQVGQTSKPIVGENGVYMIKVDQVTPGEGDAAVDLFKDQFSREIGSRVDYEVFEALKKKANVVDNRSKFY
ncbi:MAG: peptidylprolyl isomerase [Flavobacteriales bacterium]|nr:peptidylprolyl isomerase [Flavobacteriales bacterium]